MNIFNPFGVEPWNNNTSRWYNAIWIGYAYMSIHPNSYIQAIEIDHMGTTNQQSELTVYHINNFAGTLQNKRKRLIANTFVGISYYVDYTITS